MPNANVRANAQGFSESQHTYAAAVTDNGWALEALRDLEDDIDDLARMLRGADHLHYSGGSEDLENSARLLYDKAVEMAENLNRKYQNSFPGNRSTEEARQ